VRESDRSELLNQAEPVDYSGVQGSSTVGGVTSGLYQASNAAPQPLQQTGGDWAVMTAAGHPNRRAPPRGIFDDI